jgi:hypothetical protein
MIDAAACMSRAAAIDGSPRRQPWDSDAVAVQSRAAANDQSLEHNKFRKSGRNFLGKEGSIGHTYCCSVAGDRQHESDECFLAVAALIRHSSLTSIAALLVFTVVA